QLRRGESDPCQGRDGGDGADRRDVPPADGSTTACLERKDRERVEGAGSAQGRPGVTTRARKRCCKRTSSNSSPRAQPPTAKPLARRSRAYVRRSRAARFARLNRIPRPRRAGASTRG